MYLPYSCDTAACYYKHFVKVVSSDLYSLFFRPRYGIVFPAVVIGTSLPMVILSRKGKNFLSFLVVLYSTHFRGADDYAVK